MNLNKIVSIAVLIGLLLFPQLGHTALQVNNFTGFETGGDEEADGTTGSPTFPTTSPASGDRHADFPGDGTGYRLPHLVAGQTDQGNDYIFSFKIRPETDKTPTSVTNIITYAEDAGTFIWRLELQTNGDVEVQDETGAAIRTITDPLVLGTYQLWQVVFQHADPGTIEVFIDGSSQGLDTGQDLTNGGVLGVLAGPRIIGSAFTGSASWRWDDLLIQSGASSLDIFTDVEVFKYQSVKASATPDDGGDDLNTGNWADCGQTPLNAAICDYTQDTAAGAVDSDATNGSPEGPANDSRIDGDSNIKAMKAVVNMERSGGSATAHFILMGNDVDGTTRSADIAPTTSFDNFYFVSELATIVPLSTEHARIGFEQDGKQDFTTQEMWAMILHEPDVAPPVVGSQGIIGGNVGSLGIIGG
jgi:hypothetical protein